MSIQPIGKTAMERKKNKASSGIGFTIILVLLIGIAAMGFMTAKRYFEAQQITPEQKDIKDYTKFVNENPDNVKGRLGLAYAFQKAKQYDEAREQYLEVLKIKPKEQAAMYNLGEIAHINKDYKEAQSRLEELLKVHKGHVLGTISLSQVYTETKQYDKAIKVLDDMLKIQPYLIDFHILKGQAYAQKGDKVKAKAAFEKALTFDPTNADAKKGLADLK